MSVPRKKAVVSKKVSEQQILDAKRWVWFNENYGVDWDKLTQEAQEFFHVLGEGLESTLGEVNQAADKAIASSEK